MAEAGDVFPHRELRSKQGESSQREIRVRTLEVGTGRDKSLTIFDHPADVEGTAFLSYTHATEADDQWLYLPALKRVKRIASANKSGPFMGSERLHGPGLRPERVEARPLIHMAG